MAESDESNPLQNPEEDVWGVISTYEDVLESAPHDREALGKLSAAYEEIGDHVRGKEYMVRLAELVLAEADGRAAAGIKDTLNAFAADDPDLNELALQIEAIGALSREMETPPPPAAAAALDAAPAPPPPPQVHDAAFNLASEMSFAWSLMEAGDVNQDDYASIVHDLTEMSGQDADLTVSVLHVLEAKGLHNLDEILGHVAEACGTPLISIANFEPTLDAMLSMPLNFMVRRGAVVFDFIGPDALVALLNPYDPDIKNEVKALLKRNCHFYLSQAGPFDHWVERTRETIADRASAG